MFDEFLRKAAEMRLRGESFAVALVVRFEAPISGKPGDRAIIHTDGAIWGWIGGGCAQPIVVKEALKALEEGTPRLIRISPNPDAGSDPGIVDYTMTCHSGGTLDIFIEPVLPKPQVLIFGRSAVAQSLARLAKAIDYTVVAVAPGASEQQFPSVDAIYPEIDRRPLRITPQTFIVVSTQGECDEEALELVSGLDCAYISFVASKVKARKLLDYLREKGLPAERLSRIQAPAGLEIGAVSPEEIAVSILAEIVRVARSTPRLGTQAKLVSQPPADLPARDPVCGMQVEPARAKHKSEYGGATVYFCCPHCKQAFDKDPGKYLAADALPAG
ncbi:MAG TPA: XdhC family protein [Bryobacteraceae bacterium]|nr:XdhC family protein [Bryobacteraceae bacterium]